MRNRLATTGVALAGAGVLTAAAVVPPPPAPPKADVGVFDSTIDLTAASSVFNVPLNLLIDLVNVPYNEVRALDYTAKAFMFSGPWFVVGPTNVWGVDPGDPPKFMAVVNTLVPLPALSGIDRDQFDQAGLGQQLWMYVATALPTSIYCDDEGCMPTVPEAPITGIAIIDSTIWSMAILTGQVRFPLFDNWFRVPLSELTAGYTFGPDYPGRVSPAGQIFPGFGFAGTVVDPQTGQHVVPWDGTTYTLDFATPFARYWDHLMSDPADNPIQFPTLEQIGRALQSLAASLVIAFDPITPGSVFCPGDCSFLPPALDYPGIVKAIGDLWPGNQVIDEWLDAYENGTANVPTPEQIDLAVRLKEGHFWSFGNPSPPASWMPGFNFSSLAPHFHALWTALGLNPPPLHTEPVDPSGETPSDAVTSTPDIAAMSENDGEQAGADELPTGPAQTDVTRNASGNQETVTAEATEAAIDVEPQGTDQTSATDRNTVESAPDVTRRPGVGLRGPLTQIKREVERFFAPGKRAGADEQGDGSGSADSGAGDDDAPGATSGGTSTADSGTDGDGGDKAA